ncbi:MAG: hypothetical protein AAF845_16500 [Bacteroidota bacterium]
MRFALLAAFVMSAASVQAQGTSPPRFGGGFDVTMALLGQDLIPDGPSVGIRGRAALPLNRDVSVAGDLGVSAHLFEGASQARFVANPQASVIVTLPGGGTARYILAGFGGFVPFNEGAGGPTLHIGYGWAFPLNETSFFTEINPSLLIGSDKTDVVLAARAGIIF